MIDRLPDVPFRLILSFLCYEDRFSLRRTCRKLKLLIDGQVFRNLFIFLDSYPCHQTLFHTDEPVYYADSCRVPDFERFISNKYKENLRLLKKLTIFFEGLYQLEDHLDKIEINLKSLSEENFFQEVWRLEINLEHLNFFEQVEHLEIKGVGKVFGQLSLKKLRILSVETRRLSEFDLDCPGLRAMCISFGARPNFIDHSHPLDCLSTKLLLSSGTFNYLHKLFGQCPRLSSISFDYPRFLRFTLTEVNGGRISLPLWRIIRFERPQFLQDLGDDLADCLVDYEKMIEPESLQIFFNDEPISSEQLVSIIQIHQSFIMPRDRLSNDYLNFLKKNEILTDLDWLFSGISELVVSNDDIEPDEDLVMKLKHLQMLSIYSGSPLIDERLFRKMLTSWTKLERLWIDNPGEQVGQHQLDQLASWWPNLRWLVLNEKPDDLKFVAEFKNLRVLTFRSNLPKTETMFLMQACPSLYHIDFYNETTNFHTFLSGEMSSKYRKNFKVFSKYIHTIRKKYIINHNHQEFSDFYVSAFNSPEKMVDHYYDNDLFNKRKVSSFKAYKDMFKIGVTDRNPKSGPKPDFKAAPKSEIPK